LFGGVALSTGGSKAKTAQGPPINAQSPDEESFIKYAHIQHPATKKYTLIPQYRAFLTLSRDFLKNAEGDGKSGNNVDATKKDAGR
jgi:F-type H+-transporting ATPase subunit k